MKKSVYILAVIGLLGLSCEKVIDIDVPEKSRKIVLNSVINPDSIIVVNLSQSKSILEDNNILVLEGAQAKLYEDGSFLGELVHEGFNRYIFPDFFPSLGKEYLIEVDHAVLEPVNSRVSIPESAMIGRMDTSTVMGEWGNKEYKLNVGIIDPGVEKNYYALSINLTLRIYDWQNQVYTDETESFNTYIETLRGEDSGIGGELMENELSYFIDDKLFFSDDIFTGQSGNNELALKYYIFAPGDTIRAELRVDHISPSYYYYAVSKEKYYRADGNPFTEPVQVYSNVQNGLGVFGSYSRSTRSYNIFAELDR